MIAHDYKVASAEKQELEKMLQSLESETEGIENKIKEESEKMSGNMKIIESNREILREVAKAE